MACLGESTVARLVAGDLSPEALAGIDGHLGACAECRGLVADVAHSLRSESSSFAETLSRDGGAHGGVADTLAPRTHVGRYVVRQPIGAGGMGVVYLAHDPALDRSVTLKLLREDRRHEKSAQASLVREAQAMAKLSHPNVVAVHDVGTFGAQVFIAMEFVAGENLREWLGRQKRSCSEILAMFLAAGRGLVAAHAAGMVHRDFKPSNVLIGEDGRVRVTDFGLARSAGAARERADVEDVSALVTSLTETGDLKGTPAYMAPEQFLCAAVDARTDQFSFCVALYEAVYGQRPFAADALSTLAREVVLGNVRKPPARADAPPRLAGVLARGLSADPGARFASMTELLAALEACAGPEDAPRRAPWKLVAAGLGASALLGLALVAARASAPHAAAASVATPAVATSVAATPPVELAPGTTTTRADVSVAEPAASTTTKPQTPVRPPAKRAAPTRSAAPARPYDDAPMEPSFARSAR